MAKKTLEQKIDALTSIVETDIRDMKRQKLVTRVADFEEKVFGAARA